MSFRLARGVRRAVETALAALMPADCWLCEEPLPWRQRGSVCLPCWGRLRWAPRLAARSGPLRAVFSAAVYEGPFRRLVHGLKFEGMDYLGVPLGEAMADLWRTAAGAGPVDLVVPVPLHFTRRLHRGYNQAERLARPLARRLDRPLVRGLLRRRRAGTRQTTLGRRGRLRSLGDCFRCRPLAPVARPGRRRAGPRVLLVDDVTTTGATLEACARALAAAGAASVVGCVLARTPRTAGARRGDSPRPVSG